MSENSRPTRLISFAQNREDILLARLFRPWEKTGYWIDVGAGHPRLDSVTNLFYEFGWNGINIEPQAQLFDLLQQDRPQDINIRVAAGNTSGKAVLYEGSGKQWGLSTLSKSLAENYLAEGHSFSPREVQVEPLSSILRDHLPAVVDFLKIDVEGSEEEVLRGMPWQTLRPRVILVEATRPSSPEPAYAGWEPLLLERGYVLAQFDGLNRFYVDARDHEALETLAVPVNIHDDYILNREEELRSELKKRFVAVTDLRTKLQKLEQDVSLQTEQLEETKQKLRQKEEFSRELRIRLDETMGELVTSERIREQQDKDLKELREENIRLGAFQKELHALHQTRLLRWTLPFRKAYQFLRKHRFGDSTPDNS